MSNTREINLIPCNGGLPCKSCGFLKNSAKGVLKAELGFNDIAEYQIVFPCHLRLQKWNMQNGHGKCENQNVELMAQDTGQIEVCSGFILSLYKSNRPLNNNIFKILKKIIKKHKIEDISQDIMTIKETRDYHNITT